MRISRVVMAPGGMPVPISTLIGLRIPLVGQSVHAGFPSPADDFIEDMVDLNDVFIEHPAATYLWRVVGDCMIDAKVFPGDVVVVDRAYTPRHRDIVLVFMGGDPTLKRIKRRGGAMILHNENATLPDFTVDQGAEVEVWGVVTATLRTLRK
ncbi:MAG: samA [Devosia sp.]|nr:samA [Devosia sp.]